MPTSVYETLQTQVYQQIRSLTLAEIESNVLLCNKPFGQQDIRPGGYVSPEGREAGKNTNERDEWGYKWQVTVVRGASSGRSQEMGTWMYWLQEIVREFNNKRLSLTYSTSVNASRAVNVKDIKPTAPEGKNREYDLVGVLIQVWVFEPRT